MEKGGLPINALEKTGYSHVKNELNPYLSLITKINQYVLKHKPKS